MFQEKKQEVQTAILRVDQLSQQLEDLKKGKLNGLQPYAGKLTGPAAVELKRLYQELQVTGPGWAQCAYVNAHRDSATSSVLTLLSNDRLPFKANHTSCVFYLADS